LTECNHPSGTFSPPGDLPDPKDHPSIQPILPRALELWNDLEILVGGNRIQVVLNGTPGLQGNKYVDQRNAYPRGLIGLRATVTGSGASSAMCGSNRACPSSDLLGVHGLLLGLAHNGWD
jgi:hypothetical protein